MGRLGNDRKECRRQHRIALRRQALGLTQSDLAHGVGISFQQIQKYERGDNRVSASRLHSIARVLGAPVSEFFPVRGEIGRDTGEDWLAELRALTNLPEGRAVALAFPRIDDAELRRSLARVVEALAAP